MRRLLVAGLATLALAGAGAPHASTASPTHRYWILFNSDRDGGPRDYSIRPDGSRLTPLLPQSDKRVADAISRDGTTIVYSDPRWFYVGRANGTRLHRVTQEGAGPVLSPDKRRLAVTDLNKDGRPDIVFGVFPGGLRAFINQNRDGIAAH